MPARPRPLGVTIIAFLDIASGGLFITFDAYLVRYLLAYSALYPVVFSGAAGLVSIVVGVLTLAGRRAGRLANMALAVFGAASMLYYPLVAFGVAAFPFSEFLGLALAPGFFSFFFLGLPGVFLGLAAETWVLLYLNAPSSKSYFRVEGAA